jgi:hypothetical protein
LLRHLALRWFERRWSYIYTSLRNRIDSVPISAGRIAAARVVAARAAGVLWSGYQ